MKRHIWIGIMIVAAAFSSCKKCDIPGDGNGGGGIAPGGCFPPVSCKDVACTMVFQEEHLEVKDAGGAPVNLDAFVVTDEHGVALPMSNGMPVYGYPFSSNGRYTIVNDGWVNGHQNTTMMVHAKGYKAGVMVFDEQIKIGADCCHVMRHSGTGSVTINGQ